MSLLRNLSSLFCALFFQACVQVLPDTADPKPKFALDISFEKSKQPRILKTIVVDEPLTPSILNSQKIVVEQRIGPPHITFAQNQEWKSRLPEMLEQDLILALKKTGGIKGVAKSNQGVIPDYIVVSDLNDFKIIYQAGYINPLVEINWLIKLLKFPERKIIAAKDFSLREEVPANNFSSILKIFNLQTSKILHDISLWVRHHIDKDNKKLG